MTARRVFMLPVLILALVSLIPAGNAAAGQVTRLNKAADLQRIIAESGATVTVVNYWATWCPPCRAELPEFKRLQQEFDPHDVLVIGVSFDYDEAALVRFMDRFPLGYPNYLGDSELMEELEVSVIPKTVIVSQSGSCVCDMEGAVTATMLRERIERLLGHGGEDAH